MARKSLNSLWLNRVTRSVAALAHAGIARGKANSLRATRTTRGNARPAMDECSTGMAVNSTGARRYRLYSPEGTNLGHALPLIVMLHGCRQDAESFAASTRMNRLAAKERFFVLYPEQHRLANTQGCWNWYDTQSGRAYAEAALIMAAVDQVCRLYPIDSSRVAVAGLSAGASMAALCVSRYPTRFKAVIMHSGVAPGTANSTLSALRAMRGRPATTDMAASPVRSVDALPPLLVIQGGADTLVSEANGRACATIWADAGNAQEGISRTVQRGARYAMTVSDFKRIDTTVATLVGIERLGHAWSGGASGIGFGDAKGPDASRMAWAFASKHFGP